MYSIISLSVGFVGGSAGGFGNFGFDGGLQAGV
jgi:hypothetical protein